MTLAPVPIFWGRVPVSALVATQVGQTGTAPWGVEIEKEPV